MKLLAVSTIFCHLLQLTNAQGKKEKPAVPPSWPPGKEKPVGGNPIPNKIVGGVPVDPKDRYPFQVALKYSFFGFSFQYCGGFLIAPDWVLTAAHCGGVGETAEIGRWDLSDNSEEYESINIAYELPHPDYVASTYENDYMLIKLEVESSYPPVAIDDGSQDLSDGADVTVMGWGTTSSGGSSSDILLEVEVDVVSNAECNNRYGGDITDNMLCAARSGKDACQGDSGGPLIVRGNDDSEDVVVGIVSWGIGCASPLYPGVYARISSGYDWIMNIVDPQPSPSPTTSPPTVSSAPTAPCLDLEIQLLTDEYPQETTWEVRDPDGMIVLQGPEGSGEYEPETEYIFEKCLPPACDYTFTIYDSFGDGICCRFGQGSYSVSYDGVQVGSGDRFDSEESTSFGCIINTCADSVYPVSAVEQGRTLTCSQLEDFGACSNEDPNIAAAVASHCPLTCNACDEYACEDSIAPLGDGSLTVFCSQLDESFCDDYPDLKFTCRDLCGYC